MPDGIKLRLYEGYSELFIEGTHGLGFEEKADWYYNITYWQEERRGYDSREDWFTPGIFRIPIQVGETVYITAGLEAFGTQPDAHDMAAAFEEGRRQTLPADSPLHCLENAAADLIVRRQGRMQIMAGYPWFGSWGRDTFIALPGLTLSTKRFETAEAVLDGMLADRQGALFPNVGTGDEAAYNSVDAPLWFIHAVQQYLLAVKASERPRIWKKYGAAAMAVVEGYAAGRHTGIGLGADGLIYAAQPGRALTWMDAVVDGRPVTPRAGAPVEINALWYNALRFTTDSLTQYGAPDKAEETAEAFTARWAEPMAVFPDRFKAAFWSKRHGYLADVVDNGQGDFSLRPNQIIAAALPYRAVSDKICQLIVERVKQVLLTPRGLRTLAPMDARYEGVYEGDQATRDARYHQGVVWVWLL